MARTKLEGKVALVTGAAGGIGRATALALAEQGARLVVCDVDEPGLREIAAQLGERLVLSRRTDVSSRDDMRALADEVHARVPALDVLVNNAGVGLSGSFVDTSLEDFEWIVGINLWGVIHGCHFFVPKMVEAGAGRSVVNVSSALGYFAGAEISAYATTKFAVFGLSESLRAELAPAGIHVATICPGIIATGIIGKSRFRGVADEDGMRARVAELYRKRNYGPEKVADAIVDAIRKRRDVVPVSPEAWGLWYLKRLMPSGAGIVARAISRRAKQG
ncbi:MAG: SDR family NAD(P)-dependent oxidoreductase [Myxococcota bacterium]|nr:SDR family NAD(P)-dependent oxidoreductase [Myxococcota bacterium]